MQPTKAPSLTDPALQSDDSDCEYKDGDEDFEGDEVDYKDGDDGLHEGRPRENNNQMAARHM